jgi:Holliday junction resolvase RusA-like endonuclease
MKFFVPMKLPTATHQMKQTRISKTTGKIIYFEPPTVKAARAKYMSFLSQHAPSDPMVGSVHVTVKWLFRGRDTDYEGEPKITRPDLDNMLKLLFDVMTDLGYWTDDAQISSILTQKFYAIQQGLFIEINPYNQEEKYRE